MDGSVDIHLLECSKSSPSLFLKNGRKETRLISPLKKFSSGRLIERIYRRPFLRSRDGYDFASRTSRARSILPLLLKEKVGIGHGFELQVVVAGVFEKHRHLFASLPVEPEVGLDDKLDAARFKPLGQRIKLLPGEAGPKVRDGDLVAVDGVEVVRSPVVLADPVANDLVAEEVVVLPLGGAPALLEAENSAVEFLGKLEIMHRDGQMERG
mmetsp:Transcript_22689/g.56359  ORF Transcript_22689/g.56359 Transcript_22689/m.56359 type:complete len:211 (+) Transcript_22689:28-660(+)